MNKRGQVWIETVIYILIGLSLIALVLAFVTPRINQQRDKIIIEQTIVSLNIFDEKINEVIDAGKDNRRIVEFSMKQGALYFNLQDEEIVFVLSNLGSLYSEPNVAVPIGRVIVKTTERNDVSAVNLTLQYKNRVDLTFNSLNNKKFNPSSIPYKFAIENKGIQAGSLYNIEITQLT
ncbi:MAG: hypothetical protein AABX83_02535 [Nanoarchaeota archaeon]